MPWLQESNQTPTTVSALLTQIAGLHTQCTQLLAQISTHRGRCQTNLPTDPTHSDSHQHDVDGGPGRSQAYANLINVRTQLTAIQQQLQICRTEMSHGGGP